MFCDTSSTTHIIRYCPRYTLLTVTLSHNPPRHCLTLSLLLHPVRSMASTSKTHGSNSSHKTLHPQWLQPYSLLHSRHKHNLRYSLALSPGPLAAHYHPWFTSKVQLSLPNLFVDVPLNHPMSSHHQSNQAWFGTRFGTAGPSKSCNSHWHSIHRSSSLNCYHCRRTPWIHNATTRIRLVYNSGNAEYKRDNVWLSSVSLWALSGKVSQLLTCKVAENEKVSEGENLMSPLRFR